MNICEYGCGREAKYKMTSGKWCCESFYTKCPHIKKMISIKNKGKNHTPEAIEKIRKSLIGRKVSLKTKQKIRQSQLGKYISNETKEKLRNFNKKDIKYWKNKYPLFSKIEKLREHPKTKEIQVHCKNHNCPNSKEKSGWFTPTYSQLYERIRQVEYSNGGCYFYCCEECKQECPLFNLQSDPNKENKLNYTQLEYQTWRQEVLKREDYKCEYCGESANIVHHSRPQKLEPFYSLDPDFGIACCEDCHFKYGHKDECSTGQLANKVCKDA